MRTCLRGKCGGLIAFLAIAALVIGGLGWATDAALTLEWDQAESRLRREQEQAESRAREETQAIFYDNLRLALWRLDSRVAPALAKEDSRSYNHFSAVYAPSIVLRSADGKPCPPGTVLELSPLLNAELPDWMLLHFQADPSDTEPEAKWSSPQVLSANLSKLLQAPEVKVPLTNVTEARRRQLTELAQELPPEILPVLVQQRGSQTTLRDSALVVAAGQNNEQKELPSPSSVSQQSPAGYPVQRVVPQEQRGNQPEQNGQAQVSNEFLNRNFQQMKRMQEVNPSNKVQNDDIGIALNSLSRNGEAWFARSPKKVNSGEPVAITMSALTPVWLASKDRPAKLAVMRIVHVGSKEVCQGILLDWPRLQALLGEEVKDLFPAARIVPVHDTAMPHPERTMAALPVELDPGPLPDVSLDPTPTVSELGWTPLRFGLTLAWAAALVALGAVGLGGWSLLELSERRIRFVSAVTHELRTPLTTLRLYLDMLTTGLVQEEQRKTEYLQTLHAETERLNRLVGNVLDFSRLENHHPRLEKSAVNVDDLLAEVRTNWQGRCQEAEKELVIENAMGPDTRLVTDVKLVQQIVGNLVDNACKYSRGATDPHLWIRIGPSRPERLAIEVEDRGPGVALSERRSIFRPFRRGRGADVTAGGVGLGLALAHRWARLLGGQLTLRGGQAEGGACFRLEIPCGS